MSLNRGEPPCTICSHYHWRTNGHPRHCDIDAYGQYLERLKDERNPFRACSHYHPDKRKAEYQARKYCDGSNWGYRRQHCKMFVSAGLEALFVAELENILGYNVLRRRVATRKAREERARQKTHTATSALSP